MISNQTVEYQKPEEQLSQLFGSYKAEWLKGQMFEFFTEPAYFPELFTQRPCVLIGGRGTGKTTVLKGLSYEGQFALSARPVNDWSYYGLYYCVNMNRVTAFKGPELDDQSWRKLFAHYFNLLMCDLVFRFLAWYKEQSPDSDELGEYDCRKVAESLHLKSASTVSDLARQLELSRLRFEASINNVADKKFPPLSMQGAPIDALLEAVTNLPQFKDKHFFFILDEYENFEDYQQQVVNTLIKHARELYSFKIGVRELGWRRRTTLIESEKLNSPADYVRINIVEKLAGKKFKQFALAVCNGRISRLELPGKIIKDIKEALPGLTEDEEAERLDVLKQVKQIKAKLKRSLSNQKTEVLDEIPPLQVYLLKYWAHGQNQSLEETFNDFLSNRKRWDDRYVNYKHALLYDLKRNKVGIRRYYAGWDVFTRLSAGNIRYLLALVEQSLLLQVRAGGKLSQPTPQRLQTVAAQTVGKDNLTDLEGVSGGLQLTRLLLGLGRIFGVMAAASSGHAPEVNQFRVVDNPNITPKEAAEVDELLKSAVMHLALVRSPGNKLADETETKDYDYMVHPIYSPFFVFSYRKKRKLVLAHSQLIGLIKNHQEAIRDILRSSNRVTEEEIVTVSSLPEQLLLTFEGYYRERK